MANLSLAAAFKQASSPPLRRPLPGLHAWVRIAAGIVVVAACVVFAGWAFDVSELKRFYPGFTTMKVNTAIAFLLAGVSLWVQSNETPGQRLVRVGRICALGTLTIGLATIVEYASGWDLGIDQCLFEDTDRSPNRIGMFAGRMSLASALIHFVLGLALVALDSPRLGRLTQTLTLAALALAFLPLVGYVYRVELLYHIRPYTAMAAHTSVVFIVLGIGIVMARPERGIMVVVTSHTTGGWLARRTLPAGIVLPLSVGYLRLLGQRAGYFDPDFGLAMFTLANVTVFLGISLWVSTMLFRSDTKRTESEERLQRRQAELAHVSRLSTMGELATGLAHEINQPLSAIQNYAQGCVRRLAVDSRVDGQGDVAGAELREPLVQIAAEAQRAAEIIRRLRRFVGQGAGDKVAVHVNELVQSVGHLVEFEIRRRGVTVGFDLSEALPCVLGDSIQLEQVVLNLVRNSLEAMDRAHWPQLELTLETRLHDYDRNFVEMIVSDTGIGLPAGDAERIFDPFFSTKPDGLGMGLSISRSIVESHGGRMWAQPKHPHGATFHLTLPALAPGAHG